MRGELYIMTTRGRSHYLYISITYFSKKKTGKSKESTTASLPGASIFSLSESQNSRTSLKKPLILIKGATWQKTDENLHGSNAYFQQS